MSKSNKKKSNEIIKKINNEIIEKNVESSYNSTDEDSEDQKTNMSKDNVLKENVKKFAKIDEKIKEKKGEKNKIINDMKKKYNLKDFNEQIKSLNDQKKKIENNLICFLEKTGKPDPIIDLGSWGTLKLCVSNKKTPLKLDLIEKSIEKIVSKKKIFDSESKKDKFIASLIEQIDEDRSNSKKYLKKTK